MIGLFRHSRTWLPQRAPIPKQRIATFMSWDPVYLQKLSTRRSPKQFLKDLTKKGKKWVIAWRALRIHAQRTGILPRCRAFVFEATGNCILFTATFFLAWILNGNVLPDPEEIIGTLDVLSRGLNLARDSNTHAFLADIRNHGDMRLGVDSPLYQDLGTRQIRLLVLRPDPTLKGEIICTLQTVSIDSLPIYEALSYAWGENPPLHRIRCNGHEVPVGENLFHALRELRHGTEPRLLWIDAICIDQKNVKERGDQVSIMKDIYSLATGVIVWLGLETPEVYGAVELLQRMSISLAGSDTVGLFNDPASGGTDFSYRLFQAVPSSWNLACVEALLKRPWFRRTWVVQEVASARKVTVLCGRKELHWSTLVRVLGYFRYTGVLQEWFSPEAALSSHNVLAIQRARHSFWMRGTLLDVLLSTTASECSDLRDKVYGVLSLAKADGATILRPDYTLDPADVYKKLAIWSIKNYGNIHILSCARDWTREGRPELAHLPSWVPDWTRIENDQPFVLFSSRIPFKAHKRRSHRRAESLPVAGICGDVLVASGVVIDCVEEVGNKPSISRIPWSPQAYAKWQDEASNIIQWISESQAIAARASSARGSPLKHDEFWRTMTCSLTGHGRYAPRAYGIYFSHYRDLVQGISQGECVHRYHGGIAKIESSLHMWIARRRFARTSKGRLAVVPRGSQPGDKIVILNKCAVPYVLRPTQHGTYTNVGEAYVHGVMYGEIVNRPRVYYERIQIS